MLEALGLWWPSRRLIIPESVRPGWGHRGAGPIPHKGVIYPRAERSQGALHMNEPNSNPNPHSQKTALTRFRALNFIEDLLRRGGLLIQALLEASRQPWPDENGDYYAVRTLEDWETGQSRLLRNGSETGPGY